MYKKDKNLQFGFWEEDIPGLTQETLYFIKCLTFR